MEQYYRKNENQSVIIKEKENRIEETQNQLASINRAISEMKALLIINKKSMTHILLAGFSFGLFCSFLAELDSMKFSLIETLGIISAGTLAGGYFSLSSYIELKKTKRNISDNELQIFSLKKQLIQEQQELKIIKERKQSIPKDEIENQNEETKEALINVKEYLNKTKESGELHRTQIGQSNENIRSLTKEKRIL